MPAERTRTERFGRMSFTAGAVIGATFAGTAARHDWPDLLLAAISGVVVLGGGAVVGALARRGES